MKLRDKLILHVVVVVVLLYAFKNKINKIKTSQILSADFSNDSKSSFLV